MKIVEQKRPVKSVLNILIKQKMEKIIMTTPKPPRPKSWKEVEALPFVAYIEKESNRPPDEPSIWVQLDDNFYNDVTGGVGGGFYVCNFNDFISHYWF